MKRLCLFAGYDSKGVIHDYVVYYLRELSSYADIYYMSDNEFSSQEYEKIRSYVKYYNGYHHSKYDFGSWQELINHIGMEKISEYDELILANDSVFGPLYSFNDLFRRLENDKNWDICGIDRAYDKNIDAWYISSYFMIFKKEAFLNEIFINHFKNIPEKVNFEYAVNKLEHPLMKKFYSKGYKVKCLIVSDSRLYHDWRNFIKRGIPFLKKKIFDINMYIPCKTFGWRKFLLEESSYSVSLIDDYLDKTRWERIRLSINALKRISMGRIRKYLYRRILKLDNENIVRKLLLKLFMVTEEEIENERIIKGNIIVEIDK